jgi:hypothetical protein
MAVYGIASTTTSPSSPSPASAARTSPDSSPASVRAFPLDVPSRVAAWPPASSRVAMPRAMLPVPMIVISIVRHLESVVSTSDTR